MQPEIVDLARSAGTTVVALMATDAWQRVRDSLATLWNRSQPNRTDGIIGELESTREDILAARESGDPETELELTEEWSGRVRRLLANDPSAVEELRRILDELATAEPVTGAQVHTTIHLQARAEGESRVYQAGRDQHIAER